MIKIGENDLINILDHAICEEENEEILESCLQSLMSMLFYGKDQHPNQVLLRMKNCAIIKRIEMLTDSKLKEVEINAKILLNNIEDAERFNTAESEEL